jgi:large subunit ribosomal protein L55
VRRSAYARLYPAILVKPDGSSININYTEPISVVQLPFDINTLSEVEKRRRLLKRQMTSKTDTKKVVEKEQQVSSKDIKFDPRKYINMKN